MKKVSLDNFRPGTVLDQDLYSTYGVKLVPRGTALTDAIMNRLKRVGRRFYVANDIRRLAEEHCIREIDPAVVRTGMEAPRRMLSLGGRLLSETAERIESHHKDSVQYGLFQQLEAEPSTIAAQRRELADEIVNEHASKWTDIDESRLVSGEDIDFEAPEAARWPNREHLIAWREERVDRIRREYSRMLAGLPADLNVFELIVDELLGLLRRDPSRFAQVGLLCPQRCDYLPDHAMSAAVLAMVVAARENYSLSGIRLAGLTGLLHDVGMLLIPDRIRTTQEQGLSDLDQSRILQHPAYSLTLLDELPALPEEVRWAAYRHHERDNGKGYPHGLKHKAIGELPRLMAVADVAAAMLGNRPFRDDKLPHEALMELVQMGREGEINRSLIRYLVDSIGLYPIGSYVRLSTGEGAQVVGIHAGAADRPVVRICDRSGHATRREIDLLSVEPWAISILKAISPREAARRMYPQKEDGDSASSSSTSALADTPDAA